MLVFRISFSLSIVIALESIVLWINFLVCCFLFIALFALVGHWRTRMCCALDHKPLLSSLSGVSFRRSISRLASNPRSHQVRALMFYVIDLGYPSSVVRRSCIFSIRGPTHRVVPPVPVGKSGCAGCAGCAGEDGYAAGVVPCWTSETLEVFSLL
ncbi:hypothetical protein HD554DRAFT_439930 [Boletus coccyginus]|nr:hypothetical protein HD554DRAFT_439930 [Boletus coccyginus]